MLPQELQLLPWRIADAVSCALPSQETRQWPADGAAVLNDEEAAGWASVAGGAFEQLRSEKWIGQTKERPQRSTRKGDVAKYRPGVYFTVVTDC